jgi:hypothetical protein
MHKNAIVIAELKVVMGGRAAPSSELSGLVCNRTLRPSNIVDVFTPISHNKSPKTSQDIINI